MDRWIVATASGGQRSRLEERAALMASGTIGKGESPLTGWAIVRCLLVEYACRLVAGATTGPAGRIIADGQAKPVVLSEPVALPLRSTKAAPTDAEWGRRDDPALLARIEEIDLYCSGAPLTPHPGDLVQIPIAVQQVGSGTGVHYGCGSDQAEAGMGAVLAALRAAPRSVDPKTRWRSGPVNFAGVGFADALADALGRLCLVTSVQPHSEMEIGTLRGRHWCETLRRRAGESVEIRVAPDTDLPSVYVATVEAGELRGSGFGVTASDAAEHALRGALTLSAGAATYAPMDSVNHLVGSADALVAGVLGVPSIDQVSVQEGLSLLRSRVPGLLLETYTGGDKLDDLGFVVGQIGLAG